jgi:hypothetical protein
MTLGNGRAACELPLSVFSQGNADSDECPVFAGLGLSLSSARRHVEGLCQSNFLEIYRVVADKSGVEMAARVAEINFKKLFSAHEIAKVGIKLDGITPSQFDRGPYEYIHRYFVPSLSSFGLGKPNLSSPAFGTATVAGGNMLAIPKKQRRVVARAETVADVIARTTEVNTATRNARAIAATASPIQALTVKGLQALIDKAMLTYLPDSPRVIVTEKAFGLMRKRLKEARIANLSDFIEFTIRSWFSIASQNKAAHRKDITRLERGSALPSAPSFTVLAYKLPYFVAVYSNHLMDKNKGSTEVTALQRRVAIAEEQLQRARQDNAELRQKRLQARARPAPKVERRELATLDDDWTPPEWQSPNETKKKA